MGSATRMVKAFEDISLYSLERSINNLINSNIDTYRIVQISNFIAPAPCSSGWSAMILYEEIPVQK